MFRLGFPTDPPLRLLSVSGGSHHTDRTRTVWKIKVFYLASAILTTSHRGCRASATRPAPGLPAAPCPRWALPQLRGQAETRLRHKVNDTKWALPEKLQRDPRGHSEFLVPRQDCVAPPAVQRCCHGLGKRWPGARHCLHSGSQFPHCSRRLRQGRGEQGKPFS